MNIFRVAAITGTNDLGLAIAQRVREENIPFLHCIGADDVNQANKAVATTNNILKPDRRKADKYQAGIHRPGNRRL